VKLLMVAGGRNYVDFPAILTALEGYLDGTWVLITGAARGADEAAESLWRNHQLPYIGIPARWKEQGRSAGPWRTLRILDGEALPGIAAPNLVVAFPGGKGTAFTVRQAEARHIKVVVVP
jgi:hypothetical protein